MAFLLEGVLNTIAAPDIIFKGDFGESISVKKINDKYLVVPYKEEKDGFIITAYITKKIEKKRNYMGSQKISMIEGIRKIYSDVEFDYDEEVDVLYVSFGKPSKAISEDLGNGVILKYNEENDDLVGMTLIGIKKRSTH